MPNPSWRIIEGDCRDTMSSLDAGSVQVCVTSPPYYGLRDYGLPPSRWADGWVGCLGLEPTPDMYVAHMVEVFAAVRRVLRDDGTVWLNLGDSYAANRTYQAVDTKHRDVGNNGAARVPDGMKPKDLIGIPWMVAFALRADGWYLRSDIVWSKPNPMPESVTDRPTKAHEYLFLLSKSARYYYDADAIRETAEDRPFSFWLERREYEPLRRGDPDQSGHVTRTHTLASKSGRNKRSVWTVATQPFPGAHFATFPAKLIEPCILAGCSERVCGECGAPWERVVERTKMVVKPTPKRAEWQATAGHARTQVGGTMIEPPMSRTVGFEPSCGHGASAVAGTVLDPFAGSGTTGMVALRNDRSFVGCELSPEYARMARERIIGDAPLLNSAAEKAA